MEYKICTRCIMDTSDPDIYFNNEGICNHCERYDIELPKRVFKGEEGKTKLDFLVDKIKKTGKNKDYDCIIGVSGGVDSTYVAYLCKQLGLRPLAIHFDNGWNSDLAVTNIKKVLDGLNIDLYTYVIDWEEFRSLQRSFLKVSTADSEVPTDHAISALLFREASNRNIKYIISGMNFATESIGVPAWSYGHSDWKYIKSVHKIFENTSLKSYPHFSFINLFYWTYIKGVRTVSILNYIEYNKKEVMDLLQNVLGWVYYGGKHYESIYTRFFQGYILPAKFNIDKRRGHLSDFINSGQLSRAQALIEIAEEGYPSQLFEEDKVFVMKKLGFSEREFGEIMNAPIKSFRDYPNNYIWVSRLKRFVNFLRLNGFYSK
jgi:N-acetyl sugar amidotransferase